MQFTLNRLRYIIRRLARRTSGVHQAAPRGLPTEILLLILSYLGRKDLLAVARSSRQLSAAVAVTLYASLRIGLAGSQCKPGRVPLDERRQILLYRSLRLSEVAKLVTEIRIDFSLCGAGVARRRLLRVKCSCDKMDRLLGQALYNLEGLRVLNFSCYCCKDSTDSRHLYLRGLNSTRLERLIFQCRCMPRESNKPFDIFTSPGMRSLTGIGWPRRGNSDPQTSMLITLEDKGCLPLLKELYFHQNIEAVAPLINKGTIEHLRCGDLTERVQELVDKHPGILKTLRVKRQLNGLPTLIAQHADTYINVSRVGRLYLAISIQTTEQVISYLRPLACLPNLKTLDVLNHCKKPDAPGPWKKEGNDGLIILLGDELSMLRRVYIKSAVVLPSAKEEDEYYTWSRSDRSGWRLETVLDINGWHELPGWSWKGT